MNFQILKSKTVLFAILLAVLSVLQGFVFHLPISPLEQAMVGCIIAIAVTILRLITTQPISQK